MAVWKESDKKIVVEFWPTKGSRFVQGLLSVPKKLPAIQQMAYRLGLKCLDYQGIREESSLRVALSSKSCDYNYFRVWSPNMAYIAGYIFADGSISRNVLSLLCSSRDEELIIAIRDELKSSHAIQRQPARTTGGRNNGPRTSICICSRILVKSLEDVFGLCPRKTYEDLPVPNIPDEYFGHFLRGFFDGDGHVKGYENSQGVIFKFIGTEKFVIGMRDIIYRLTKISSNKLQYRKIKMEKDLVIVSWTNHKSLKAIYNLIYPEGEYIFLRRKKQVFDEIVSLNIRDTRWSKKEDMLVESMYRLLGLKGLKKIPNRTYRSSCLRAKNLNLFLE